MEPRLLLRGKISAFINDLLWNIIQFCIGQLSCANNEAHIAHEAEWNELVARVIIELKTEHGQSS